MSSDAAPAGTTAAAGAGASPLIRTSGLTVRIRGRVVLSDVSVQAGPGVVALAGPNGSGKTTLLRVLATLRRADAGAVSVAGHQLASRSGAVAARRALGYLPQGDEALGHLRVDEAVSYAAWLAAVPRSARRSQVSEVIDTLDLGAVMSSRLRTLSGGTRQRAALAQVLVHRPAVLLLDEPSTGVDAEHRVDLRATLRSLAAGRLVILSTHLTEDIELLADRVLALAGGRLVFDGTPTQLAALAGPHPAGEPARAIERGLQTVAGR